MTDDDSEFYPAGTTVEQKPTEVPCEPEPSHVEEVPDDDLAGVQVCDVEAEPIKVDVPISTQIIEEEQIAEEDHSCEPTPIPCAADGTPRDAFGCAIPEPSGHFEYAIDLGDLPASSEERVEVAVGVLKAVERSLGELEGDFKPETLRRYNQQLQDMLDSGITLFNLILGRWALERVYQVGEAVYFKYYGVDHLGHVETIAKSKVLIRFKHRNKDRPNDEPREILTWRDKDQVKKP